jgi:hypothetical protein
LRPHWVREPWRYWEWLDRLVTESGGFLAGQDVIAPEIVTTDDEEPDSDGTNWDLLVVFPHILNFYDGRFLKFETTVNADLNQINYAYHYGEIGGDIIWRACMNDHRIDEIGSSTHLHLSREDNVMASGEVDLDDAIKAIHNRRPPGI